MCVGPLEDRLQRHPLNGNLQRAERDKHELTSGDTESPKGIWNNWAVYFYINISLEPEHFRELKMSDKQMDII